MIAQLVGAICIFLAGYYYALLGEVGVVRSLSPSFSKTLLSMKTQDSAGPATGGTGSSASGTNTTMETKPDLSNLKKGSTANTQISAGNSSKPGVSGDQHSSAAPSTAADKSQDQSTTTNSQSPTHSAGLSDTTHKKTEPPTDAKVEPRYTVRLAMFREKKSATSYLIERKTSKISAEIVQDLGTDGKTWYTVVTGNFATVKDAKAFQKILMKKIARFGVLHLRTKST